MTVRFSPDDSLWPIFPLPSYVPQKGESNYDILAHALDRIIMEAEGRKLSGTLDPNWLLRELKRVV